MLSIHLLKLATFQNQSLEDQINNINVKIQSLNESRQVLSNHYSQIIDNFKQDLWKYQANSDLNDMGCYLTIHFDLLKQINTILNEILSMIAVLELEDGLNEEDRFYLTKFNNVSHHLISLFDNERDYIFDKLEKIRPNELKRLKETFYPLVQNHLAVAQAISQPSTVTATQSTDSSSVETPTQNPTQSLPLWIRQAGAANTNESPERKRDRSKIIFRYIIGQTQAPLRYGFKKT